MVTVANPHSIRRFGNFDLEKGTSLKTMLAPLEELGYKVNLRSLNSGIHPISIGENGLLQEQAFGVKEYRRECDR